MRTTIVVEDRLGQAARSRARREGISFSALVTRALRSPSASAPTPAASRPFELITVDGAGVLLADEQDMLVYAAASDGPGRLLEQTEAEAGEGPCTEAFVQAQVVTSRDVTAETDRWPTLARVMAAEPVRAVLGTPVVLGGVPVGTLDV